MEHSQAESDCSEYSTGGYVNVIDANFGKGAMVMEGERFVTRKQHHYD
ncbi:hypothetical protein [Yersinia aldovae]|uniref:Uncharacterized protein n=1 Tax=Yersinia aldovae TaxID=29483 RepID=A0A0T9U3B3_YERAL|nr:hypothetical protein [Yersinia aldovae]AJJ62732.1 hypothetical protein AT01_3168 [Yersinia aldovae 670-83]CNJ73933.1 Uncharacterised protein [Yersinia aldovae]CNK70143.1 Uncharacterised protein [Yersinia aldovae]CNL16725.1 Uncharacterised protein [Yersinia aldovae]